MTASISMKTPRKKRTRLRSKRPSRRGSRSVSTLDISADGVKTKVLRIREMTKDQVRKEVLAMLQRKETTDLVELHGTILCDLWLLLEVMDDLKEEGLLGEVDDA